MRASLLRRLSSIHVANPSRDPRIRGWRLPYKGVTTPLRYQNGQISDYLNRQVRAALLRRLSSIHVANPAGDAAASPSKIHLDDSGLLMPGGGVHPTPYTLNPQPSTPNPTPSTLNPQPSTLNPQPSTLNPQPSTLNPTPSTLDPEP